MKSRAASNLGLYSHEPRLRRASSCPLTFVFGKLVQVGYPEAGEFFGNALSLFPSPVQMALEQAAAAILNADVRVCRPVHGPGRLRRPSHSDFVDHLTLQTTSLPTRRDGECFPFSRLQTKRGAGCF